MGWDDNVEEPRNQVEGQLRQRRGRAGDNEPSHGEGFPDQDGSGFDEDRIFDEDSIFGEASSLDEDSGFDEDSGLEQDSIFDEDEQAEDSYYRD